MAVIIQFSPYAFAMLIATILLAAQAIFVLGRRRAPGGLYFALLMAAAAEWALFSFLEVTIADAAVKVMLYKMEYLGAVSVAPLWLLFALDFGKRTKWLKSVWARLLWLVPIAILVLVATNEWHGLMWSGITPVDDLIGARLIYEHGPGDWALAVYSYALLLVATVLLIRTAMRSTRSYRGQIVTLVLGAVIPWTGSLLYLADLAPFRGLELTPLALTATGLLFAWGIFRQHIFELVPVAHETLIGSMVDGVLVIDRESTIVNMNPAAMSMLGTDEKAIGQPLAAICARCPALADIYRVNEKELGGSREISLESGTPGSHWVDLRVSILRGSGGEDLGKVIALWDITSLKQSNEELVQKSRELQESEERWHRLVEYIPAGVAVHSQGKVAYVNRAGLDLMGATTADEIVGKPVLKFIHPDYHESVKARIGRMLATDIPEKPMEEQFLRLDGKAIDVEVTTMPIVYMGKKAILTVIVDIGERKHTLECLEVSLKEKELLLKEIHHRVKNNLQIISSLLSLQTDNTASSDATASLKESQSRIKSMALIHEKLYRSKDLALIDFREYTESLIGSLAHSYVVRPGVQFEVDIRDVSLDIDNAIPCGLIINELVSNSLKYAFTAKNAGTIRVSLKKEGEQYKLVVSDDGAGLPAGVDFRNTTSLGLQLVVTLTEQLNGTIEHPAGKGTTFIITFSGV